MAELHWNQSHWAEFIFESLTRQVRTAFYFRSLQGRNSSRVICYDLLWFARMCSIYLYLLVLLPLRVPVDFFQAALGLRDFFQDLRTAVAPKEPRQDRASIATPLQTVADRGRSQQPWLCHGMRGRADIERKADKPLGHCGFILRHRRRDAWSYDMLWRKCHEFLDSRTI